MDTDRLFVLLLFVVSFFVQADHLIIVPLCAEIAYATGFPLSKSGLLVSVYPFAAAISAFLLAPFSDRFGRKRMLLFLIVGFCISCFGFGLSQTPQQLITFRVLSGVFGGIILPNALAFVSDRFEGQQRIKAISTLTLAFPLANTFGIPLGAWLGDELSWRLPFFVIAAVIIVVSIPLFKSRETKGENTSTISAQYLQFLALWKVEQIRRIFVIQFFMLIGLFSFVPHSSLWLTTSFNMSATDIGICYMQGGIGAILGNLLARHLLQRKFQLRLIAAGSITMGVMLLLFTREIFSTESIGLAFALIMFGGSLRMPALQLVLSELASTKMRGRLLSMNMIVANATMAIGGMWTLMLISVDGGHIKGIQEIGWVSFFSLLLVPFLLIRFNKARYE